MEPASTVLIVDDDPVIRKVLGDMLLNQDYILVQAADGVEALAQAAEHRPDLILLDVMMPNMDGFEVCRRLRADPALAEAPVVMVTSLDDRASRLRGIEAGADDFITKPFDRVELRARVHTITRLNRYRRLQEERSQLAWVVEHADDGYLRLGPDDEVLYANPKARLYLGVEGEPEALVAEKFLSLALRQYRLEPQDSWAGWPALSPKTLFRARYLVRPETPTAPVFWLEAAVLNLPGAPRTHLIRLKNVTAQIKSRRDMRSFITVIGHKLRTPLVPILGILEMASEPTAWKISSEDMINSLSLALRGAQRLHAELEDILKFAQIPALVQDDGGFSLSQFEPLVTEISAGLELRAVTMSMSEDVKRAQVALPPQAVEVMLWEILENAKKFHPAHSPTVEIEVVRESAGRIALRVGDDGVTLSPEQMEQVWTPYYQAEKGFTGELPGMGLGLSTVASLVWGVGGACRLYNRKDGPGIVVELILPEMSAAPAP
ncbi:MAG TPA: response regulator [Anaerolineales bacterium]|nr:response regulator [Anaerolineales bacterium]